jgi:lipopolysaccharide transport system permease protein
MAAQALPIVEIGPNRGSAAVLRDVWEYRELLYFLVWRDLKVRYKQTALGVLWIVLQPAAATLVFTVVFGYLLSLPSSSLPYPVFVLAGLLPWTYFATSLNRAGGSLVTNAQIITKVYFPRILIPLAGVINGLPDVAVSLLLVLTTMLVFGVLPAATIVYLPLYLLLAVAITFGMSLWLAALNVHYRDVNQLLPFMTQVLMYATPIIYPSTVIPERWRALYGLNPMATVVEGFRWSLSGQGAPPASMVLVSIIFTLVVLVTGMVFFRRTERTFADIV